MNTLDTQWRRLTALARTAPTGGEASAPPGFATRVVAHAFAASRGGSPLALFEKFALRGLVAAGVLSLASVAYSYTALTTPLDDELSLAADPLPELLDLS